MKTFRKALVAAAVAAAGTLGVALGDGQITIPEGMITLGAALLGGAAVYKVKNHE